LGEFTHPLFKVSRNAISSYGLREYSYINFVDRFIL
jgi:hypothetical protein